MATYNLNSDQFKDYGSICIFGIIHIKYFYKTKHKNTILLFWYVVYIKTKCVSIKNKVECIRLRNKKYYKM